MSLAVFINWPTLSGYRHRLRQLTSRFALLEEGRDRHAQRRSQRPQRADANVTLASLDEAHHRPVQARIVSKPFL
jgi:hypothetical protein